MFGKRIQQRPHIGISPDCLIASREISLMPKFFGLFLRLLKYLFQITVFSCAAGFLFIVCCNVVVVGSSQNAIYDNPNDLPHNNVGLVLGCSKKLQNGTDNPFFYNRIQAATELFKAGKIDYILVSGGNDNGFYNEARDMQNALMERNIPKEYVYCDYSGFSTFDSVVRTKDVFRQEKFTVISQAFHNPRAVYIARRKGVTVVAFNAEAVPVDLAFYTRLREYLARVKAIFDIYIIERQPIDMTKHNRFG